MATYYACKFNGQYVRWELVYNMAFEPHWQAHRESTAFHPCYLMSEQDKRDVAEAGFDLTAFEWEEYDLVRL